MNLEPDVRNYDSIVDLLTSMDFLFYMNGRFPATNGLIWVPEADIPKFISGEKLFLKCLYELFRRATSHGLVSRKFKKIF